MCVCARAHVRILCNVGKGMKLKKLKLHGIWKSGFNMGQKIVFSYSLNPFLGRKGLK